MEGSNQGAHEVQKHTDDGTGGEKKMNKYGSLMPKKNVVHQQQYFDSADWQMKKNVGEGSEGSRLKPAYMMSPSKGGVARGKSKLSSTSLSDASE